MGTDGGLLESGFTDGGPGGLPVRVVHPGIDLVTAVGVGDVVVNSLVPGLRQIRRSGDVKSLDEVGVHAVRPLRLYLRVRVPYRPVAVLPDMGGDAVAAFRTDAGVLSGNPPVAIFSDRGGISLFPLKDAAV